MDTMASQITSLMIVYSTVYSHARKHQSSASLAFVRGIRRGPVNFPHKWPVTRKIVPFDDVIMLFNSHDVGRFPALIHGLGRTFTRPYGSQLSPPCGAQHGKQSGTLLLEWLSSQGTRSMLKSNVRASLFSLMAPNGSITWPIRVTFGGTLISDAESTCKSCGGISLYSLR